MDVTDAEAEVDADVTRAMDPATAGIPSHIPTIPWSAILSPTPLSHGTTTQIQRATLHGLPIALKTLSPTLARSSHPRAHADLLREAHLNGYLRHPHIVQFLGLTHAPPPRGPGLLFELAEGGALQVGHYGARRRIHEVLRVCEHVALALAFAHARGVMHRDVKPSQVLLFPGDVGKLGDWGLARACPRDGRAASGETGTWEFMAPEVIRSERYDTSADVYSFGVLAWCVAHGEEYPYADAYLTPVQAATGVSRGAVRPKFGNDVCCKALREVIERCWEQDASKRPDMKEVVHGIRDVAREEREKANDNRKSRDGWGAAAYRAIWGE